jgi:hypothetical protein
MKIDGMTNENLSLQCKNGMCSDLEMIDFQMKYYVGVIW